MTGCTRVGELPGRSFCQGSTVVLVVPLLVRYSRSWQCAGWLVAQGFAPGGEVADRGMSEFEPLLP
jgi:hypothetical protein